MSSFESTPNRWLTVTCPSGPARIEIRDEQLKQVGFGFGSAHAQVSPGIYSVQWWVGTEFGERLVRVPQDRDPPVIYIDNLIATVVPFASNDGQSNVHAAAAFAASRSIRPGPGRGSLIVFARVIGNSSKRAIPTNRISLHVGSERVGTWKENPKEGWAYLAAEVPVGGVVLRWKVDDETRDPPGVSVLQSIWVTSKWATIVFVGYSQDRAKFDRENISIYMADPDIGFMTDLPETRSIATALDYVIAGLKTGRQVVPNDLLDLLLNKKFGNPMLGIAGAYAMLQRREVDWRLLNTVLDNLDGLLGLGTPTNLGLHPDLVALRRLRELRQRGTNGGDAGPPVQSPPMFVYGYKAIIEADWDFGGMLIAENSQAARAVESLTSDFPWTCWMGRPSSPKRFQRALDRSSAKLRGVTSYGGGKAALDVAPDISKEALLRVAQLVGELQDIGEATSDIEQNLRSIGLPMQSVIKAYRLFSSEIAVTPSYPRLGH